MRGRWVVGRGLEKESEEKLAEYEMTRFTKRS
jgi:hypothetical protein